MKIGMWYQRLAYLAAAASAISVILAVISRFTRATIVISQNSFMNFAIVAILFAIYFLVQGMVSSNNKG